MSFAFLGRIEGRLCLYSQLTGVVPEYQSRGLGYQIKLFQRQVARSEGIERIAWAFDPLQAGNAHFNLTRLGAHARRFVENMYGRAHRPAQRRRTHRSAHRRVGPRGCAPCPALLRFRERASPPDRAERHPRARALFPSGYRPIAALNDPRLLLEIPIDITALRSEDPATGREVAIAGQPGLSARLQQVVSCRPLRARSFDRAPQRILRARAAIMPCDLLQALTRPCQPIHVREMTERPAHSCGRRPNP